MSATPSLPDDPYRGFAAHAAVSSLNVAALIVIWAASGFGSFWPIWVAVPAATSIAIHWWIVQLRLHPEYHYRGVGKTAGICVALAGGFFGLWAASDSGSPWFLWPWISMGIAVGGQWIYEYRDDLTPDARLTERVDTLERTRSGALEVQTEQLRRIERDLHDGAQSRLVALSMQLGRAEERLESEPEAAALVRAAREEARAAIAELRDLARGIAPPVLADRGLGPAIEALAQRAAIPVETEVTVEGRLAPVVEAAAYFVVAEALTNIAKHAPGASARVHLARVGTTLVIEVADDGPGGAVLTGSGLTGLRHRIEALDGTLHINSPAGEGTTIRAVLPCGS